MENKIIPYLRGRLSKEEARKIKQKIEEDDSFAEEVALQQFEMETINQLERDELRKLAKNLKDKIPPLDIEIPQQPNNKITNSKPNSRLRFLLIAAASIALLIVIYFFSNQIIPNNDLSILVYNSAPPEYSNAVKGSGDVNQSFDSRYVNILINRNKAKTQEAIDYFQSFSPDDKNRHLIAQMNLGHAYVLNDDSQKAMQVFASIETDENVNKRFRDAAGFYKVAALLKANDIQKARLKLQNIANDEKHNYQSLAFRVLNELDRQ